MKSKGKICHHLHRESLLAMVELGFLTFEKKKWLFPGSHPSFLLL